MTTFTFKRLPFSVELPSAPVLDPADISPLVPPPVLELDAYWLFGSDNTALTDIDGGNALQRNVNFAVTAAGTGYTSAPAVEFTGGGGTGMTATAVINAGAGTVIGVVLTDPGVGYTSAPTVALTGGGGTGATATATLGAAPTLGTGYAELPDGTTGPVRNGLILPFADSLDYTLIQVLRFDTSAGLVRMWQGTLTASSTAGSGGEGLYRTTGVSVRTQTGSAVGLTLPAEIVDGAWVMVAQSFSAGTREVIFIVDGVLDIHEATGLTKTLASPLRKLAIGNGYYTASGAYPLHRVAAAAYKAGTIDHGYLLDTIYPTIRDELASRGITLL